MTTIIKTTNLIRRKRRVRAKVFGIASRPRLSVRRTNTRIIAQIINDGKKETLAYSSDLSLTKVEQGKNKSERAFLVGKDVGAKALAAGVKEVVFDRHGYLYHGRVQKLADGARAAGLIF